MSLPGFPAPLPLDAARPRRGAAASDGPRWPV